MMKGKVKTMIKYETFSYKKNELIVQEGEQCLGLYTIIEGQIVIKNIHLDGTESIVKYVREKENFADILVLSQHDTFPASIYANTDCKIKFVSKNNFIAYLKENPNEAINFITSISNQAYSLNNKLKLLNKKTIKSKLCYYIKLLYDEQKSLTITIPFNREELSKYLNIERPSLSRELANLKKDNVIDFYLNTIKINNLSLLESYL